MRVVLDSNIITAAFAARGLCTEILFYVLQNFDPFYSINIVNECERIFLKKLKLSKPLAEKNINFIKENFTLAIPTLVESKLGRDKNDLHILGLADEVKAKFIITGDQDLLVLKKTQTYKDIFS